MRKTLFLCVVLLCCAACGPSPQAASQSFLLSSSTSVAFVSWTDRNGNLTGRYAVATRDGAQEYPTLSGQQNANQISLTGQGVTLTGFVNGNLMQTSDMATGNTLTWYAGNAQEYASLKAVYQAYLKVQGDLDTLTQVEMALPGDSDPAYFHQALSGAVQRISNERKVLDYIDAQTDPFIRCSAVSEFALNFPTMEKDPELHVPFATVNKSHLAQALTSLSADFQKAEALPFPVVSGLHSGWKVDPSVQIRQATKQVVRVQQAITQVSPQFEVVQQQATLVQQQVAFIKQQDNC